MKPYSLLSLGFILSLIGTLLLALTPPIALKSVTSFISGFSLPSILSLIIGVAALVICGTASLLGGLILRGISWALLARSSRAYLLGVTSIVMYVASIIIFFLNPLAGLKLLGGAILVEELTLYYLIATSQSAPVPVRLLIIAPSILLYGLLTLLDLVTAALSLIAILILYSFILATSAACLLYGVRYQSLGEVA